jgi:hypothetical protein
MSSVEVAVENTSCPNCFTVVDVEDPHRRHVAAAGRGQVHCDGALKDGGGQHAGAEDRLEDVEDAFHARSQQRLVAANGLHDGGAEPVEPPSGVGSDIVEPVAGDARTHAGVNGAEKPVDIDGGCGGWFVTV